LSLSSARGQPAAVTFQISRHASYCLSKPENFVQDLSSNRCLHDVPISQADEGMEIQQQLSMHQSHPLQQFTGKRGDGDTAAIVHATSHTHTLSSSTTMFPWRSTRSSISSSSISSSISISISISSSRSSSSATTVCPF